MLSVRSNLYIYRAMLYLKTCFFEEKSADVAQLVEQLIRNQ